MINSQEIIERSIYSALLDTAVSLGHSLNPNNYLPVSKENKDRFDTDVSKITKYVGIYGTGNNQSKGEKITPRIIVNARGFYPGSIGLPKLLIQKEQGIGFTATEEPYETIDQFIDIHLVANNQDDLRLLHQIMFFSIPQRGYIKPYNVDSFLFSGNIFIELVNFFDTPNLEFGIMEKIYQFIIQDCVINESTEETNLVPITDISVLLDNYGYDLLNIK